MWGHSRGCSIWDADILTKSDQAILEELFKGLTDKLEEIRCGIIDVEVLLEKLVERDG